MKLKITIIFFLIFTISNPSFAKWGKGPLKLSKDTMEVVLMYMYGAGNKKYSGNDKRKNNPTIMAISKSGYGYMYSYCPAAYGAAGCMPAVAHEIILACEKYSNGSPCFIFAKKRRIVWDNGQSGKKLKIKVKDLKSPYKVAKMIQDAGFYDGDISKLAGINVNTGQVDNEISITGENKSSSASTTTQTDNSSDIVKELETLSNLYKSGSLSKSEFEKAKKKLLKN